MIACSVEAKKTGETAYLVSFTLSAINPSMIQLMP